MLWKLLTSLKFLVASPNATEKKEDPAEELMKSVGCCIGCSSCSWPIILILLAILVVIIIVS